MHLRLCFLTAILFLSFRPALAIGNPGSDEPKNYKVYEESIYKDYSLERVIDGDTFVASGQIIRIWGVDAPEKDELYYKESTKALELILKGAMLRCKFIELDTYHRSVMHCLVSGADLGGILVKSGWAKDFPKYSASFYKVDETFALDNKLGIWNK